MKRNKFTKLQEEWLEALESGDYKQGRCALCRISGSENKYYCCLGVACEVYNKWAKRNKKRQLKTKAATVCNIIKYDGEGSYLPDNVRKKLHLITTCGRIIKGSSLVNLNDDGYTTHGEIAKFIRENPGKVFTNFDCND